MKQRHKYLNFPKKKYYNYYTKKGYKVKDLTGKRFGKLTVLNRIKKRKGRNVVWKCKHENGTIIYATGWDLKSKRITGRMLKGRSEEASFNRIFYAYKQGARLRNLSFKLSKKIFMALVKNDCYYCGNEPIKRNPGHNNVIIYMNGIDRLNNKKGYTIKNCVPCCKICNKMKWEMSHSKFLEQVINIYDHQKDGNDDHTRSIYVTERNAGMRGSAILKHIYDLAERDNFQKADIIKYLEALVEEHIIEIDEVEEKPYKKDHPSND